MAKIAPFLAVTAVGSLILGAYKYGQFLARTEGISSQEMALVLLEQRRQSIRLFFGRSFDIKDIDEIRAMIASRSKEGAH